ncbi:MAG: hypothetical protein P1P63_07640 [Treponemataceae bacterium]
MRGKAFGDIPFRPPLLAFSALFCGCGGRPDAFAASDGKSKSRFFELLKNGK